MTEKQQKTYKILTPNQWKFFQDHQNFSGSPDDKRDGFIHLCFANQLETIIEKYFAAEANIFILELDFVAGEVFLRLESNKKGEIFPHFYRDLHLSDIKSVFMR